MGFIDQFRALLKKNLLLWRRNIIASIFEIIFPVIMISIIVIVRSTVATTHYEELSYLDKPMTFPYYVEPSMQYNVTTILGGAIPSGLPFQSCISFKRYIFAFIGSSRFYPLIQQKIENECIFKGVT